ncbi:hypothetical protein JKP88DRAFT_280445 [Tribonema minus]|uniref:Uncharacterized protein n=1 Tax=Tribonema minus TaxID=303371 RepID=A0A835YTJ6_9STRA|nr:hypothetical protein JKP88DRAFT_280445 [Tribonema minus]
MDYELLTDLWLIALTFKLMPLVPASFGCFPTLMGSKFRACSLSSGVLLPLRGPRDSEMENRLRMLFTAAIGAGTASKSIHDGGLSPGLPELREVSEDLRLIFSETSRDS